MAGRTSIPGPEPGDRPAGERFGEHSNHQSKSSTWWLHRAVIRGTVHRSWQPPCMPKLAQACPSMPLSTPRLQMARQSRPSLGTDSLTPGRVSW